LPHLLSQRKLRGEWVCYHGGERIGIGSYEELIRECCRRGISDDASYVGRIRPQELPPWEPEDVEPLGPHHREDNIYPDDLGPRLPVLGLRALTQNQVHVAIDPERMRVSLRTPDWTTKILGWFGRLL